MEQLIKAVEAFFQIVPPEALGLIFGSLGASALQQKIKKWFELEGAGVIQFITVVFSFAAAVIPSALGWLSANPESLGVHTATFFMAMTLSYRYAIKPGTVKLNEYKEAREGFKEYKANLEAKQPELAPVIPTPSQPALTATPAPAPQPIQNTNIDEQYDL